MEELVREVIDTLGVEDDAVGDKALPIEESQTPAPISLDNFQALPDGSSDNTVTFIDGGNSEVLGASNFSLQLIRTAAVTYEGKEKRDAEKDEFYLLVKFKDDDFEIKTFPGEKLPELSFSSLDPELTNGRERVKAGRIAGVCRRIAELKLAKSFSHAGYVFIDGDLHARTSPEESLLKELAKSDSDVCGLSKTTSLMTEKGRVFAAALSALKRDAWHYLPVFRGGVVNVSFLKLHSSSNHVFRLDSFKPVTDDLLSLLKSLSRDPVFPGYPYPLVEVDRLARVGDREKEYFRTKLMTTFGSDWERVKSYLHTRDAHTVLDNIG